MRGKHDLHSWPLMAAVPPTGSRYPSTGLNGSLITQLLKPAMQLDTAVTLGHLRDAKGNGDVKLQQQKVIRQFSRYS